MAPIILQLAVLDHPEESERDTGAQTKIQYLKKLIGNVISVYPEACVPVKDAHCNSIPLLITYCKIGNTITGMAIIALVIIPGN